VAVTVLAGLALILGTGTASAHARLERSDPPDGAILDSPPQRISLTFSDPMTADFNTIAVVGGPNNTHYEMGPLTAQDTTVSIGVRPLGPAGRYEIGYRVVSEDGHPVTGSVAFTLTTPGPGAAAAASGAAANAPSTGSPTTQAAPPSAAVAGQDTGAGAPVWPWIVGAVVLVGGGVVAALRLSR
jgi:methionine-rich copper-binding protein CopC